MANVIITVVGSSNTDLVVQVPHMPLPGETLLGSDAQRHQGGKGANQAVAARRLGAEVWFIGCLGDDDFGDATMTQLTREGLRLDHLTRVAGVPSGIALIAVTATGENAIIVAPGANAHLTTAAIDAAAKAIAASQGVIAQLETPLPTVHHALAMARASGVTTLLNPAPVQPLSDALLALVDVLVCNETEATGLSGHPVVDVASATLAAHALRQHGPRLVVVTLGGQGCLILGDGAAQHIPAFTIPVVDTTAAGDAFIGALAVQLAQGLDAAAAARYAAAAAALAVSRDGAQPSLPTQEDVARFLLREEATRAPHEHPQSQ